MTHAPNDGGPAFPNVETEYDRDAHGYNGNTYSFGGMSLLDYFAAAAMQGMLACQDARSDGMGYWPRKEYPQLAEECYALAESMLAEKAKRAAAQEGGAE